MDAQVAVQKPLLYRPVGLVVAIMGLIVLWSLMPGNRSALALLAVIILFIMGLKKPIWAMAALLVSQLTISSYMFGTPFGSISLRLLLLVLTLFVMWRALREKQTSLGPGARGLIIPILVLTAVSVTANMLNSGFDFAFKDFRNMLVGLLVTILLPAVISNKKDLKFLCGVAMVVITASALIGLMQHYDFLGMEQATLRPGFLVNSKEFRVPGMSETELELAYILPAAILVAFSIWLARGVTSGRRKLLFLFMLLMVPALYFTYTRSALFALGLGLIALVLFLKTKVRGEIIVAVLLLAVTIVETTGLMGGLQFGGRSESGQKGSALSRPILWQAGIAMAIDNPILGIGGNQFLAISPQYARAVDSSLMEWEEDRYWAYRTLGNQQPHNDFLNVWVSYGTLALVVYLWLYFVIVRNFVKSHRMARDRLIKGFALGMAAALVTYGVNAFYHNMMNTLPLLWVIAGFSLATYKLAAQEKTQRQTNLAVASSR
ncbi:MAG: O-antigen ligase family protein [Chloroflexi bacterium]|nr:O-antigen ligase family protein [Chloroflexota bacterium]